MAASDHHQDRLTAYSDDDNRGGEAFRSTQSGSRSAILNNSDTQWVRCHSDELKRIPTPGTEWKWRNVGLSESLLQQLSNRDLIEQKSREDRTWITPSKTFKAIQQYTDEY